MVNAIYTQPKTTAVCTESGHMSAGGKLDTVPKGSHADVEGLELQGIPEKWTLHIKGSAYYDSIICRVAYLLPIGRSANLSPQSRSDRGNTVSRLAGCCSGWSFRPKLLLVIVFSIVRCLPEVVLCCAVVDSR